MSIFASIVVALAALLHGGIFLLESVWWRRPAIWRRFGVRSQEQAEALRSMAYNQGFYNLFLGVGAALGLVMSWSGAPDEGRALVLFTMSCMVLAAIVLVTTGKGYARAALVQGTLPFLGLVLVLLA